MQPTHPDLARPIELAHAAARKIEALKAFHKQIGTQPSRHEALKVKDLHEGAQVACDMLNAHIVALCPAHWEFRDWSLVVGATGQRLNWESNTERKSYKIYPDAAGLLTFMGFALGVFAGHPEISKADLERHRMLGLAPDADPDTEHRFRFSGVRNSHRGRSAGDAWAKHLLQGIERDYQVVTRRPLEKMPHDAFARGRGEALGMPEWSAFPVLRDRIKAHPGLEKLPQIDPGKLSLSWGFEEMDAIFAGLLALLDAGVKEGGDNRAYLLTRKQCPGVEVTADNPAMAMAGELLKELQEGRLPQDLPSWSLHLVGEDVAQEARVTLARFRVQSAA